MELTFKKQLKFYLSFLRLTQSELSRRCGIPQQNINLMLNGSFPRDPNKLLALVSCLSQLTGRKVTIENLLWGKGFPEETFMEASAAAVLSKTEVGKEWVEGVYHIKVRKIEK